MNVAGLDAMRRTMQNAQSIAGSGEATPANASSILNTGSDFLTNASAAVESLGMVIEHRQTRVDQLKQRGTHSPQLDHEREQIDLLQRLRDRIQLSIQRVSDILAGKDRDDDGQSAWTSVPRPWDTPSITATTPDSTTVIRAYGRG